MVTFKNHKNEPKLFLFLLFPERLMTLPVGHKNISTQPGSTQLQEKGEIITQDEAISDLCGITVRDFGSMQRSKILSFCSFLINKIRQREQSSLVSASPLALCDLLKTKKVYNNSTSRITNNSWAHICLLYFIQETETQDYNIVKYQNHCLANHLVDFQTLLRMIKNIKMGKKYIQRTHNPKLKNKSQLVCRCCLQRKTFKIISL